RSRPPPPATPIPAPRPRDDAALAYVRRSPERPVRQAWGQSVGGRRALSPPRLLPASNGWLPAAFILPCMPYLERSGDVFVLYLGNEGETDNENRFSPGWIDAFHAALDEVEASEGPAALVTVATGKFYSNGLDTDWVFGNLDKIHGYLDRVHT